MKRYYATKDTISENNNNIQRKYVEANIRYLNNGLEI